MSIPQGFSRSWQDWAGSLHRHQPPMVSGNHQQHHQCCCTQKNTKQPKLKDFLTKASDVGDVKMANMWKNEWWWCLTALLLFIPGLLCCWLWSSHAARVAKGSISGKDFITSKEGETAGESRETPLWMNLLIAPSFASDFLLTGRQMIQSGWIKNCMWAWWTGSWNSKVKTEQPASDAAS